MRARTKHAAAGGARCCATLQAVPDQKQHF